MDYFVITSVINTNNSIGWTYTATRSTYTPEQRYKDTLKSIQSIRDRAPSAKVVVLEGSNIARDQEETIKSLVDIYINYYNDEWVREGVDSNKKGLGELRKMMRIVEFFNKENIEVKRLFKLSGRYWLNENFILENYSKTQMTFKITDIITTVLYSIPWSEIENYYTLLATCNFKQTHEFSSGIESLFKQYISGNYSHIPVLGVEGFVAVTAGEFYRS